MGWPLTEDEEVAGQLLSEQMAGFSGALLASYGLQLPPDVDIAPLAEFGIQTAMELCVQDFAKEIHATTQFVGHNMVVHGVRP